MSTIVDMIMMEPTKNMKENLFMMYVKSVDVQQEISNIIDFAWNSSGNNWAGHHFIDKSTGWKIKTSTVAGKFGPEGENVSVYDDNMNAILHYTYIFGDSVSEEIVPAYKYIKQICGCSIDYARACAELLYSRWKFNV